MKPDADAALQELQKARLALSRGKRREARRYAQRAVALSPSLEEGWLILAALASPRASLAYLKRALEINPASKRARQGMHWAIQRQRDQQEAVPQRPTPAITQAAPQTTPIKQRTGFKWAPAGAILVIFLLAALAFSVLPDFLQNTPASTGAPQALVNTHSAVTQPALANTPDFPVYGYAPTEILPPTQAISDTLATAVEAPMDTSASSSPQAPLESPTTEPTAMSTSMPTGMPTALPTATPTTTPTMPPSATSKPLVERPEGVGTNERWIDVDLSEQRVYAYEGDQMLRRFRVSTGTWRTPTVAGFFRVYVKYRYATMTGPGYYLPNVPYVMYFHKGYGLHGTYWHNNFGTPTSHGCINLKTEDAAWLFKWASVGTVVYVHK